MVPYLRRLQGDSMSIFVIIWTVVTYSLAVVGLLYIVVGLAGLRRKPRG